MSLDVRAALHAEGGGAELPLVGAERVEERDVGQQRREQLIVDELIVERARVRVRAPVRSSVTVIGISRGPLPSVPAIAVARSCCIVPIISPSVEILNDDIRLGSIV